MENAAQYKQLITDLIHKQIIILGPDITLARVKNIEGLQVSSTGEVIALNADPQVIMQSIINRFVDLSGMIVRKTMESIIASYQGLSAIKQDHMDSVQPSAVPAPASAVAQKASIEKGDQMAQLNELNTLIQGMNQPKVG